MTDAAGPIDANAVQTAWAAAVHKLLRLRMTEHPARAAVLTSLDNRVDGTAIEIKRGAPVEVVPKPEPGQKVTDYLDMLEASLAASNVDPDSYRTAIAQLRASLHRRSFGAEPSLFEFRCMMREMVDGTGMTKPNHDALAWLFGARKLAPGEGGFSMRMNPDGTLDNRFNGFARETVKELEAEFKAAFKQAKDEGRPVATISPASLANRHVVPAHMMRDAYNSLVANEGVEAAVVGLNKLLAEAKARNASPEVAGTERGKLFAAVLKVAQTKADKLQRKLAGTQRQMTDAEKNVLIAMFMINSNPENLWRGNSATNSALPRAYPKTNEAIGAFSSDAAAGAATPREALGRGRDQIAALKTRVEALEAAGENEFFQRYFKGMVEIAVQVDSALGALEQELHEGGKLDDAAAAAEAVDEVETFLQELHYTCQECALAFEIDFAQDDNRGYERGLAHARLPKPSVALGAGIAATYEAGGSPAQADVLAMFASLLRYDEL